MKTLKVLSLALTAMLCVVLSSCSKDEDPPSLEISTPSINASKEGKTENVSITSNVSWSATSSQSWVSISPVSGNGSGQLSITISENLSTDTRNATVSIVAANGGLSRQVNITQAGADVELGIDKGDIEAPAEGFTESISITSNTQWSVSGYPSWVTVSPTQGDGNATLSISIKENTTFETRTCVLNVTARKGGYSRQITISQSAAEVELSVDLHEVALGATAESEQKLTINCNTSWSLSGLPDWLASSSTSGNKTATITLSALTTNNSASERTAKLTIKANDKTIEVLVKQRAALASIAVIPQDLVALYNAICFEYSATGNVAYFYRLVYSETEINRMTDSEIISQLRATEKLPYSDNWISQEASLSSNTTYYICTIAYDTDDKQGELKKTRITTPKYLDNDNDAYTSLQWNYQNSYINFYVTKEAHCHKYHAIMGANLHAEEVFPRSFYAFQINYYLKYGKKHWMTENTYMDIYTNYPNDHTFSLLNFELATFPYAVIYTWGVFENGDLSSDVLGGYVNPLESSSTRTEHDFFKAGNAINDIKLSDLQKNRK